jgi:hypothetical protein
MAVTSMGHSIKDTQACKVGKGPQTDKEHNCISCQPNQGYAEGQQVHDPALLSKL